MKCKNKEILVHGIKYDDVVRSIEPKTLRCIVSNDERGKTLSIDDGRVQYTIPFEKIARFLK